MHEIEFLYEFSSTTLHVRTRKDVNFSDGDELLAIFQ